MFNFGSLLLGERLLKVFSYQNTVSFRIAPSHRQNRSKVSFCIVLTALGILLYPSFRRMIFSQLQLNIVDGSFTKSMFYPHPHRVLCERALCENSGVKRLHIRGISLIAGRMGTFPTGYRAFKGMRKFSERVIRGKVKYHPEADEVTKRLPRWCLRKQALWCLFGNLRFMESNIDKIINIFTKKHLILAILLRAFLPKRLDLD